MPIFNKGLIKGPIKLTLENGVFCKSWSATAKDCVHNLEAVASHKFYNLVYRNGEFWGIARPMGGSFYPFSKDEKLVKPSSRADRNNCTDIELVCLTAGAHLNVNWGVSDKLIRNKDGKNYFFNAHGTFFIEIDRADSAANANIFYNKLCVQSGSNVMTDDELRKKLKAAFENRIAAVIQETLMEMDDSLDSFIDVMATEALEIGEKVYKKVKGLFSDYGLTIVEESSIGSIIAHVGVRQI